MRQVNLLYESKAGPDMAVRAVAVTLPAAAAALAQDLTLSVADDPSGPWRKVRAGMSRSAVAQSGVKEGQMDSHAHFCTMSTGSLPLQRCVHLPFRGRDREVRSGVLGRRDFRRALRGCMLFSEYYRYDFRYKFPRTVRAGASFQAGSAFGACLGHGRLHWLPYG